MHELCLGKTISGSIEGCEATTDTATSSRSTRRAPAARDGWNKIRNLTFDQKEKILAVFREWRPKTAATEMGTNRKIVFRKIEGDYDEPNNVVVAKRLTTQYADSEQEHVDTFSEPYAASSPFATRVFENTIENNTKKLQACGPKCVKVLFKDGPHTYSRSLENV